MDDRIDLQKSHWLVTFSHDYEDAYMGKSSFLSFDDY